MMTLVTFIVALAGFIALALSMGKHHRTLFGAAPAWRRSALLRFLGWLLLAASLVPAVATSGPTVGMVLWCGVATAAALAVALGLTYGPRPNPSTVKTPARSRRAAPCVQEKAPTHDCLTNGDDRDALS